MLLFLNFIMLTETFKLGRTLGKFLWDCSFLEKLQAETLLDKQVSLQVFFKLFTYGNLFLGILLCSYFWKFYKSEEAINKNNIKLQKDHYLNSTYNSVFCNKNTNKSTLIACPFLISTLTFGLFKVSSQDSGELVFSRDLASFLLTLSIPITYITDSIVCVFVWSYFKCL